MKIFDFFFFWYKWIHNLCDYSTYKIITNIFFALNLKIDKILRSTIPSTYHDST